MTLSDCEMHGEYTVAAIGGDVETHRRLVDMGLLGATATVRARKRVRCSPISDPIFPRSCKPRLQTA